MLFETCCWDQHSCMGRYWNEARSDLWSANAASSRTMCPLWPEHQCSTNLWSSRYRGGHDHRSSCFNSGWLSTNSALAASAEANVRRRPNISQTFNEYEVIP